MKIGVYNIEMQQVKELDLLPEVFAVEPRRDILARVIHWQLAKRQSGNHATKERGDVSGSTKKIYRQKGTGGARHGARRGAQFRGGGIIFGPHPRTHEYDLPKKLRKLALRMALSLKVQSEHFIVLEDFTAIPTKVKAFRSIMTQMGESELLFIDAHKSDNLLRACANLKEADHLPVIGANVYDIVRKDKLILTVAAVAALEARLQ